MNDPQQTIPVIRAGIIGSGFAASFHYEAMKRVYCANLQVVGAFSPNEKKLSSFTAPRGIKAFQTVEELITACDVLHLCTPPATHEQLVTEVLRMGKHVIVEKPFTGYFGDDSSSFNGDTFPRNEGLKAARASIRRMLAAEKESSGSIMYAENWVYAPAIQKEREVLEKTNAQVLWIQAQQSHSGSHSLSYGQWHLSGGGSLMGKGCHALAAALYLKRIEGLKRNGVPIRPKTVSARSHAITRMPGYRHEGHLMQTYKDIEDYAQVHVVFEDETIADVVASELLQGGVKNYLEVHANNHRTICNIAPNTAMQTFNPVHSNFDDIYVVEKTATKQGWSFISPDEAWFNGYQHEMEAFYRSVCFGDAVESNSQLAADVILTIYTAYISAEAQGIAVAVELENY